MKQKLVDLQDAFDRAVDLAGRALGDVHSSERLIERIGRALDCDWGTLWKVDPETRQLCPLASWNSPAVKTAELERDTRSKSLSLSEGNAGHVWRSQKPIWTLDLIRDMCIPRSLDAVGSGLKGGVWFAIKTERAVYGVVELLGRRLPPPTAELLAGIEILGIRIGEAIEAHDAPIVLLRGE